MQAIDNSNRGTLHMNVPSLSLRCAKRCQEKHEKVSQLLFFVEKFFKTLLKLEKICNESKKPKTEFLVNDDTESTLLQARYLRDEENPNTEIFAKGSQENLTESLLFQNFEAELPGIKSFGDKGNMVDFLKQLTLKNGTTLDNLAKKFQEETITLPVNLFNLICCITPYIKSNIFYCFCCCRAKN